MQDLKDNYQSKTINKNKIENKKNINLINDNNKFMNINFFNKKYIVKIHKIISSNLNMYNLTKSKILKENIINDEKLSLLIENKNSSYLLNYFNNIYLINRVNDKLLITYLKNKKTMILSDNKFFKLSKYNFYLTFGSRLIIPIVNKKVFNNQNGLAINYFEPNV